MAGSPNISRLGVTTERLQDVRFLPVQAPGDGRVVMRAEMQEFVRQTNDRLQSIQTALNDVASAVKFASRVTAETIATETVTTAVKGNKGDDGKDGKDGKDGDDGADGASWVDMISLIDGNVDGSDDALDGTTDDYLSVLSGGEP